MKTKLKNPQAHLFLNKRIIFFEGEIGRDGGASKSEPAEKRDKTKEEQREQQEKDELEQAEKEFQAVLQKLKSDPKTAYLAPDFEKRGQVRTEMWRLSVLKEINKLANALFEPDFIITDKSGQKSLSVPLVHRGALIETLDNKSIFAIQDFNLILEDKKTVFRFLKEGVNLGIVTIQEAELFLSKPNADISRYDWHQVYTALSKRIRAFKEKQAGTYEYMVAQAKVALLKMPDNLSETILARYKNAPHDEVTAKAIAYDLNAAIKMYLNKADRQLLSNFIDTLQYSIPLRGFIANDLYIIFNAAGDISVYFTPDQKEPQRIL